MLKNWIVSAVTSLALLAPLAAAPAAQAHDREEHRGYRDHDRDEHRHHCYEVMYRPCCNDPWSCYGRFDCREEAEHAEHHLRHQGYEACVR